MVVSYGNPVQLILNYMLKKEYFFSLFDLKAEMLDNFKCVVKANSFNL